MRQYEYDSENIIIMTVRQCDTENVSIMTMRQYEYDTENISIVNVQISTTLKTSAL